MDNLRRWVLVKRYIVPSLVLISSSLLWAGCQGDHPSSLNPTSQNQQEVAGQKEEAEMKTEIPSFESSESNPSFEDDTDTLELDVPSYVEYANREEWGAEIQKRFEDQEPYFFPSDDFLTNYSKTAHPSYIEFIYNKPSEKAFEFTLYQNDTPFRILTEAKHQQIPHPHTVHDAFFGFSKTPVDGTNLTDTMTEFISDRYQVELEEGKDYIEKVNAHLSHYKDRFYIYQEGDWQGLWHKTDPSTTEEEMVDFLTKQHENLMASFPEIDQTLVIAVQMAKTIDLYFYFVIDDILYRVNKTAPMSQESLEIKKIHAKMSQDNMENPDSEYITEEEALEVAKNMTNDDSKVQWSIEFDESYPINPDQPDWKRPVWIVTATHPFENRTVFYIDAITKAPEIVAEIEAPHFGEGSEK